MRLRTSLGPWTAAFFATLGLSPLVACGGTTISRGDGQHGEGGAGAQGVAGGAGSSAGGGGACQNTFVACNTGGGGLGTGGGTVIWEGVGGTTSYDGGFWGLGGAGYGAGGSIAMAGGSAGQFLPCRNPVPRLGVDGKDTGIVDCAGGSMARIEGRDCGSIAPRAGVCPTALASDGGTACTTDADCTIYPNGYCTPMMLFGAPAGPGCSCNYGCVRDADCSPGNICACGNPVGQCMPATCTGSADCGGGLCLSYTGVCAGLGFACQTYGDTCASDTDCASPEICAVWNGTHACATPGCGLGGRPFLVGGAARVADTVRREDWTSSLSPCLDGLDAADRRALAARWTELALMEHASIAAFARFALEVMSLGAPPELLVGTHAAMADETVHARDAFALASAYAGAPVGPGKLDVEAALASRSPRDVVRTTILEGCIGETIAAVEAAEALAHATDPAVRAALGRVTRDETRHAELAWRFVQWVLANGDDALRQAAATELVAIVESQLTASGATSNRGGGTRATEPRATLLAHGVVDDSARHEIRRRVLSEIVLPCARALASTTGFVQPSHSPERQRVPGGAVAKRAAGGGYAPQNPIPRRSPS